MSEMLGCERVERRILPTLTGSSGGGRASAPRLFLFADALIPVMRERGWGAFERSRAVFDLAISI
jgi:hypothetical protein